MPENEATAQVIGVDSWTLLSQSVIYTCLLMLSKCAIYCLVKHLIQQFQCLFIYLFVCLVIYLFIYLFVYLFICLFINFVVDLKWKKNVT